MVLEVHQIARVCHEANRAYCAGLGDLSQLEWNLCPTWQKDSAIKGVEFVIANPDAPASANHESWSDVKVADGWVYGKVKDSDAKTHPCLVPFDQLPIEQQRKDVLFRAVVKSLI